MRAWRTLSLCALLSATLFGLAPGTEVVEANARRESGWLVVDLRLAELLDARTLSTIESGLPGSCLLEVELRDARDGVVALRRFERSLEVDLWEDVVRMIEAGEETVFASIAEADSAWSRWSAMRIAPATLLSTEARYELRISVHVQPLGSEERERVSRWVSQSERDDRRDLSIDMGGLVRRFFGSPDTEEDVRSWTSAPFTLATLESQEP